ncbi:IclR family transcriptional regulator [Lysinibacillus sp. FSL R7-0073]|uniref:Transcriptional regulator n=1 Tax=Lysinibacillus fusiformis TaxID=28031 RepID=A0A1E4R5S0_9BACI|nr:IclR family transcriptional regulator [Lysinibacillus fusiformis]MBD8520512.1 IclR family transcriptional regulator [Lysinibacillus fusiformis]MED4887474.1 IclR family transcriptional regulator [Lysinibacillus fusiformis]ODV55738.1 transcriptional regulator [Lysinibacillus fusiformis]
MSKTLEKGINILTLFTEEKPSWRLDELAIETDIPKPTLHRFLKTFTDLGVLKRPYVQSGGQVVLSDHYLLGNKLIELGAIAANSIEIRSLAIPYMKMLQQKFDLAVQLVVLDETDGLYIEKIESLKPVLLYTRVGRRAPLYAGACSRILLSFQGEEKINEVLHKPRKKYASGTPHTDKEIHELIELGKKNGYAYSVSELEEGTVSIAVPIFNSDRKVEYSISIAGIESLLPQEKITMFLEGLWETAALISAELGYSMPYPYGV